MIFWTVCAMRAVIGRLRKDAEFVPYGTAQHEAKWVSVPAMENKEERGVAPASFVRPFPPSVTTGVPDSVFNEGATFRHHDWFRFNRNYGQHSAALEQENIFQLDGRQRTWVAQPHTAHLGTMEYFRSPALEWDCTRNIGEKRCECSHEQMN